MVEKFKTLPDNVKQFVGLITVTVVVILFFTILNNIFGGGDELIAKMKAEEERIAQERKLNEVISKLPSGILVAYDGTENHRLTDEIYESVCKVTKLIPQRAVMGANLINYKAFQI